MTSLFQWLLCYLLQEPVMLPPHEIYKELYNITKNNVNTGFYKTFSQEQITGYFKQWK